MVIGLNSYPGSLRGISHSPSYGACDAYPGANGRVQDARGRFRRSSCRGERDRGKRGGGEHPRGVSSCTGPPNYHDQRASDNCLVLLFALQIVEELDTMGEEFAREFESHGVDA